MQELTSNISLARFHVRAGDLNSYQVGGARLLGFFNTDRASETSHKAHVTRSARKLKH